MGFHRPRFVGRPVIFGSRIFAPSGSESKLIISSLEMQLISIRRSSKSGFWSTPTPLRLRRRRSGKTPPPGHQHHCCRAAYSNAELHPSSRTAEVPSLISQQRHRLRDAATAGMASPKWSKTSVGTLLAIDSQWERIFSKILSR